MENLTELHKSQLKSDRASSRSSLANQMRPILHAAAYWLMPGVRDAIPKTGRPAVAEFKTIRERLLNIAARVAGTVGKVRLAFATAGPQATLFRRPSGALQPAGP